MMNYDEMNSDILIADDKPENLRFLKNILRAKGYKIRAISKSFRVLDSVEMKTPDLVLLDIMMPGMSGYEICRKLKACKATQDIPVIFLSILDKTRDKLEGFEAGGVDYITKPFVPEEVLARVAAHMGLHRLQRRVEMQNRLLKEQNERYSALERAAFDGIFMHEQGKIVEVSDTMARMFGYPREEIIGRDVSEIISAYQEMDRDRSETEAEVLSRRNRGFRKDGTSFPMEIREGSAVFHGRTVRVAVIRDISWRKEMEILEEKKRQLESETSVLRATLSERDHFGELVGKSPPMQRVYEKIIQAAVSGDTVIIYGETGTGKELVARTVFSLSDRYTKDFVAVNCGAVQEPVFESQFSVIAKARSPVRIGT